MRAVRVLVAIVLFAVVLLIVGALVVLVHESTLSVAMGVGSLLLLAAMLLGIGRGIQTRIRPETPYW